MSNTNLPGLKAAHRIVTPVCRANKGDMEAGIEAALSLSDSYDKYSKDDGGNVRWHFVLIREDGGATCRQCGAPIDTREVDARGSPDGCELTDGTWVCSRECWDAAVNSE